MNETTNTPVISAKLPEFIIIALLSCMSGVTSIVGNTIVLIAIYRTNTLHTISNFFIASLAAADLVVGIFLNPLLASKAIIFSYLHPERPLNGSTFDKVEDFAWIQAVVATTFGLAAISVDRYIAVNFGLRYEELATIKRFVIATASLWLISLVFATVRLFTDEPKHLSILWLVMGVVTCLLPVVIITFCYVGIFKSARNQVRKILRESSLRSCQSTACGDKNSQISHRKTAFTIAIVIILFIVLWFPSLVTAAIQFGISASEDPKDQRTFVVLERKVWIWVSLVAYFSSAINPWIYSIRCEQFRAACKKNFTFSQAPC